MDFCSIYVFLDEKRKVEGFKNLENTNYFF